MLNYEADREEQMTQALLRIVPQHDDSWEALPGGAGDGSGWVVPTIEEVQEELVDRKRRRLLDKLG